jgi:hypothetical protein
MKKDLHGTRVIFISNITGCLVLMMQMGGEVIEIGEWLRPGRVAFPIEEMSVVVELLVDAGCVGGRDFHHEFD